MSKTVIVWVKHLFQFIHKQHIISLTNSYSSNLVVHSRTYNILPMMLSPDKLYEFA